MGRSYDDDYPARFKVGDRVVIARPNGEAELPDDECDNAGEFEEHLLGREITLEEFNTYDRADNSWMIFGEWVHEGALEFVQELTQEDEDAAIASILKAAAPKHLPLTEDGYHRNAEDCPACTPNLDKMPYPFICPGPEAT